MDKYRVIIWSNSYTPKYTPETKSFVTQNLYMNVHGSIIHYSQKVETTQMSIN